MTRLAVIDYGLCNLDSISRALQECGADPFVTSDPDTLGDAAKIVLPGVGAFGDATDNLRKSGMVDALSARVFGAGVPFLGICLGMHLMMRGSEENADAEGLGWLDAQVLKFKPRAPDERIPHVGWNEVNAAEALLLFDGIEPGTDFYFVHSYHVSCAAQDDVAATTPYCGGFVSAVARDNMVGVQFHPEKSQKAGFRLLENFLEM